METISQFFKASLIAVIRCYCFMISKLLGNCCRFTPSCSNYTMQAIAKYGCLKGLALGGFRILRCHPWHPGGQDELH